MRPKRLTLIGLAVFAVVALALVAFAAMKPSMEGASAVRSEPAPSMSFAGPTKVAFIGDSYTEGRGDIPTDKLWPALVSQAKGWRYTNFARGGTGYVTAFDTGGENACGLSQCPNYLGMVPAVVSVSPDVVIVAGGRNDAGKPVADIQKNAVDVFAALRKGLPKAKIFATSPVLADDDTPSSLPDMKAAVKAAVQSVGGTYIDLGAPLGGHPELIGPDNIHPNEAGQKALADVAARLIP